MQQIDQNVAAYDAGRLSVVHQHHICCGVGRVVFEFAKDIRAFVGHYGLPKRRELHAERQTVGSQKA